MKIRLLSSRARHTHTGHSSQHCTYVPTAGLTGSCSGGRVGALPVPLDHCDPTSDATQRNRPWSLDEVPTARPTVRPTTINFLFLVFCIFMVRLYFKRHARCVRGSTPNFIPKQDTPTATHSLWSRSSARPGCWDCDALEIPSVAAVHVVVNPVLHTPRRHYPFPNHEPS